MDNTFCMDSHNKTSPVCNYGLKRKHNFYFQLQGQMAVCNVTYCDFVCWSPKGIHVQRISRAIDIFANLMDKLDVYFKHVILPELLIRRNDPGGMFVTDKTANRQRDCHKQHRRTEWHRQQGILLMWKGRGPWWHNCMWHQVVYCGILPISVCRPRHCTNGKVVLCYLFQGHNEKAKLTQI